MPPDKSSKIKSYVVKPAACEENLTRLQQLTKMMKLEIEILDIFGLSFKSNLNSKSSLHEFTLT